MNETESSGKVVSFIDIGTNSIRLLVVRINPNRSYTLISEQKEIVRLGETEFKDGLLTEKAMDRAVRVVKNFCDLSRAYGTTEFISVATSATREARNQTEFLQRLKDKTGLNVSVVSGKEEARLIYLGVSSGYHIGRKKALFIDIGGGSTEIAVGDQTDHSYLDSLKMGAIRFTTIYLKRPESPIPEASLNKMRKQIENAVIRTRKEVLEGRVEIAFASSGTAINVAEILTKTYGGGQEKSPVIRHSQLKKLIQQLSSMDIAARRRVPGINPERADIIVAGAVILESLMTAFKISEVVVSSRGLKEGLLEDYLSNTEDFPGFRQMSVRERSVVQLARSCSIDEEHARRVSTIVLQLFDSGKKKGLHDFSKKERELLAHASLLHDVGDFVSFNNHHEHTHYIIRNAELLGFSNREIEVMANVAKYHRKRMPKKRSSDLSSLDDRDRDIVIKMSTLLRMAESLDRSHSNLVQGARFTKVGKKAAKLILMTAEDPQLELWRLEEDAFIFKKAFGRGLVVEVKHLE